LRERAAGAESGAPAESNAVIGHRANFTPTEAAAKVPTQTMMRKGLVQHRPGFVSSISSLRGGWSDDAGRAAELDKQVGLHPEGR